MLHLVSVSSFFFLKFLYYIYNCFKYIVNWKPLAANCDNICVSLFVHFNDHHFPELWFFPILQFFFKATLLQQVNELLQSIRNQLDAAHEIVNELESSIRPITRELNELHEKIKNMEHVEEISQELQNLKKKLAWSWVYHVDQQIQEQNTKLEKLKERVPTCQARIDKLSVCDGSMFKFHSSHIYMDTGIFLCVLDLNYTSILGCFVPYHSPEYHGNMFHHYS